MLSFDSSNVSKNQKIKFWVAFSRSIDLNLSNGHRFGKVNSHSYPVALWDVFFSQRKMNKTKRWKDNNCKKGERDGKKTNKLNSFVQLDWSIDAEHNILADYSI